MSVIIGVIYFWFYKMKLRYLSKSVAELGLLEDLPYFLSDPNHRTPLPFTVDIIILSFVIAFERIGKREHWKE